MDWWQALKAQQPLTNPLGFSEESLDVLARDWQRFEPLDSDLPARLMRYAVDGEDESALGDLAQVCMSVTAAMGFGSLGMFAPTLSPGTTGVSATGAAGYAEQYVEASQARSQFLSMVPLTNAVFCYRLGQIYALESATSSHSFSIVSQAMGGGKLAAGNLQPVVVFLIHASQSLSPIFNFGHLDEIAIEASLADEMLVLAGEIPGSLVQLTYGADPDDWTAERLASYCASLKGFAELSLQHRDLVLAELQQPQSKQRCQALQILKEGEVPSASLTTVLAKLAVGSTKKERQLAAALLKQDAETAVVPVREIAQSSKAAERLHAVTLLWELVGGEARSFLETRLEVEKSSKVKGEIEQLLAISDASTTEENAATSPLLPPVAPPLLDAPVPEAAVPVLQDLVEIVEQGRQRNQRELIEELTDINKTNHHFLGFGVFSVTAVFGRTLPAKVVKQLKQLGTQSDKSEATPVETFQAILAEYYQPVELDAVVTLLQAGSFQDCKKLDLSAGCRQLDAFHKQTLRLLKQPALTWAQALRWLIMVGQLARKTSSSQVFGYECDEYLNCFRQHHPGCGGLRELAAVFAALGLNAEVIGEAILHPYWPWPRNGHFRWEAEAIWPYFAERVPLLVAAFNGEGYGAVAQQKSAFAVLGTFPQLPAVVVPKLWTWALGKSKQFKRVAQRCLERWPETQDRVLDALRDRAQENRIAAAEWLARLDLKPAIEPMKAALKREKQDAVKDTLMRSLEQLGASVDEFLDRASLQQEAETALKQGIPKKLAWFPFKHLPAVAWADTQQPVAVEFLTWAIVQAWRQKKPDPSPMLRRYVTYFEPVARENLGLFVLDTWIGQDTQPKYSQAEAEALAQPEAARRWIEYQQIINRATSEEQLFQHYYNQFTQSMQASGQTPDAKQLQFYQDWARQQAAMEWQQRQALLNLTEESVYQTVLGEFLRQVGSSAIKEKGLLAVAGACCGAAAVPIVGRYLKTWYGMRAAQCKALIQMLSWIEDASAIQLLLSVANRFRTRSIQKEAENAVNAIAQRKGWSRDELADRTIPTTGLDENGILQLDYGNRQFSAQLDSDFKWVLTNEAGKTIKSLPAARKDDDAEQVKATKKQFSNAKKQLKQMLKLQKERLYEAMCTQRSWRFCDWEMFLQQHPIMGRYCQSLVWVASETAPSEYTSANPSIPDDAPAIESAARDTPERDTPERDASGRDRRDRVEPADSQKLLRPLEDGSLTDAEDNEVSIAADARIQLAHVSIVSPEIAAAWTAHFADYEVVPLFDQLSQPRYQLADEDRQKRKIAEFEGYLLEAFQLRGMATNLGYTRGPAEDGGWFFVYRKAFAGLGLEAAIEFSGNSVPEENLTVALVALYFYAIAPHADENDPAANHFDFDRLDEYDSGYYDEGKRLPLGEVPPVMLSEVWNNLRAIAAQGTGYDLDWKKKTGY